MPLFGRLIDYHRWDIAFLIAAVAPVAGHAYWLTVNRRRVQ
jgi:hypothetical protein